MTKAKSAPKAAKAEQPAEPLYRARWRDIPARLRSDPIYPFACVVAVAERWVSAAGRRGDRAEERAAEAFLDVAEDGFCLTPTTSLFGLLLKLEFVADVADCRGHLVDNPRLLLERTILTIIRDLRRELGLK